MKHPTRRTLLGGMAALALAASTHAQDSWPTRPVKIIVPFSPGTGLDVIARGFAERLAIETKGTFTIENREGAGGTIGTAAGARAPADGYTVTFTAHAPFAVAPYMQSSAGYDPVKDFEPIAKVATTPMILITGHDSPYRQFDDLVKAAKASPGKLSYATTGVATPSHLGVETIKREAGLDIVAIPYKNTGQAMSDVISNQVAAYMPSFPAAVPMLNGHRVRALAIGSAQRAPAAPDVPTLAEVLKKPGVEASVWYGFLAPAGTPSSLVERWHAEIAKAAATSQMKDLLQRLGAEPLTVGPKEFKAQLARDAETSRKLVDALKLKSLDK